MKHLVKNGEIVMSGIPDHFTRENGQTFWGGYRNMTELHYEDGWRDEVMPEGYDPELQKLDKKYYDQSLDKVTWTVTARVIDIEAEKQKHYAVLSDTIDEISSIVSAVKNIYDPLRTNPENIPQNFKDLVVQVQALRQQAIDEIEALATAEEAVKYVVRGSIVQGYIDQLKSFM